MGTYSTCILIGGPMDGRRFSIDDGVDSVYFPCMEDIRYDYSIEASKQPPQLTIRKMRYVRTTSYIFTYWRYNV